MIKAQRLFLWRLKDTLFRLFYKDPATKYIGSIYALNPGDVVIDCGANVGFYTTIMAWRGCRVFSFEPNPYAFEVLQRNTGHFKNVTLLPKAVSTKNETMRFYFHRNAYEDQVKWSQGSSLLASKENVDENSYVSVESVNLCDFITELQGDVKLIKIDIEGAEVEVLQEIIEREIYKQVDVILVETHERKIPSLKSAMREIHNLITARGITNIQLDSV